ncbi:hypothetical protein V6N12_027857 [Hibiscus sabdariffa]|uniref:RNase H type-1 domain-containing protein n=1 Tax=Hibiscus sabdariffa TaxID=183260 RepID=A0ABR2F448_9ROSI
MHGVSGFRSLLAHDVELWRIFISLYCSLDWGLRRVMVETDCLDVIRLFINGLSLQGVSSMVRHIFELCSQDWVVSFHHVLSSGNRVADSLIKSSVCEDLSTRIFMAPLALISQLLQTDVLRLS